MHFSSIAMKAFISAQLNLFAFLAVVFLQACGGSDDPDIEEEIPVDPIEEEVELDILERLQNISNISVTEIATVDHFERLFEIKMDQPVDHNFPDGNTFSQKIFLAHVSEDVSMAFETEGYSRSNHRTRELSSLLKINQLAVEHRYFGESVPDPLEWQYLDIWQAANDHHRIVELFKEIYPKAWVSSGASKGGNSAIFHRRFFPDDVEATVAYVTPILFEEEDQRYLDYYNTVGDESCREKLKTYQRNMLLNIDQFDPFFENYIDFVNQNFNTNFTFSIPFKNIIYHSIREDYIFEFWSSEIEDCSTIPEENATNEELFNHFVGVFDIFLFFSDYGGEFWTPWLYQSKTEIGNYAYNVDHLQDLIMDIEPLTEFNLPTDFDPSAMLDVDTWVSTSASNLLLIYGEDDPWTVAAFENLGSDDVIKIVNPGTKHGTRISDLSASDNALVIQKLKLWLR